VKLKGRFTVGFALAALVPIAVAAVVTRQVVSHSLLDEYAATRDAAEQAVRGEVARLQAQVSAAVGSLASRNHPFIGGLLRELVMSAGTLDPTQRRQDCGRDVIAWVKEQGGPVMRGLSLDVLTVTGGGDIILVSPHVRATGEVDTKPSKRARGIPGTTYFETEKIMTGPTLSPELVAEAAQTARDGSFEVAVLAGRKVGPDLLATVRSSGRVDARVVDAKGKVVVPSAEAAWGAIGRGDPIRIPLPGADGQPAAWVEIAVSDGGLDRVLLNVTLISVTLAVAAVGLMILIGIIVARRTTRDLDELVAGALAAARGDLEHRVPIRSKDEIGEVGSAFNFMMEDLRSAKDRLTIAERIAAWQEVARRLAHEIKNPLTPIQMSMDTLRKSWAKKHPKFEEILEESTATVLEEADRLKRIVSEFSDFARMPKPDFQRCDLNEVVGSSLALYQGAAPVEASLFPGLPEIEADKGQLSQVLLNLVENARDAIGEQPGGKITVSTRLGEAADRVAIVVEDNGPGVPQELKEKVFQPYFTTKQGRGGTGLGLAIVHRIVSDHGGRIAVGEAVGGGARFIVELPLRHGTPLLASRI
jgi:two-component system, NtrC family, nitrogen regulation sensor histidine kinase NtrY